MKINNIISNINFGKTPVMKCCIKSKDTKEHHLATIYQLDAKNNKDLSEVFYSKQAICLYPSMLKDNRRYYPSSEYYIMKDDRTDEVISCTKTSRHYRRDNVEFPRLTTLIEELNTNPKYINSAEPMFAFLAQKAFNRFDESLTTASYPENPTILKRAKFTQTKNGDWVLPEKRFNNLIDTAQKRSNIEFLT